MAYKQGDEIYKYRLERRIGGGNFGEVWTATDLAINAKGAVKILDQDQYTIDERLLEAQIGNRLNHPNVINIKGADVINFNEKNIVVISMPYYEKGSVLSRLNGGNFLNLQEFMQCLVDILRGLEYLHENGYFHCDIKPGNILVGDKGEYLLTDYGITSYSPNLESITPRGAYIPHIAPETVEANIYDVRTDIYQLGVTAYRLINGISEIKSEFIADRDSFQDKVLKGGVISAAKFKAYIPHRIRRAIMKAANIIPEERFQTPLEMRRELEKIRLAGDCTVDCSGNLVLTDGKHTYRYEIVTMRKNCFNLAVFKKSIRTGRETRCNKYCQINLNQRQLDQAVQTLCLDIISG